MSNEAPERLHLKAIQATWGTAAYVCGEFPSGAVNDPDIAQYLRSDIAQAQTNAKVREVLLQILSSVENDSHIDVLVGINKLLNEYPDLSTNEEEKV